jgi:hypothetical protein
MKEGWIRALKQFKYRILDAQVDYKANPVTEKYQMQE